MQVELWAVEKVVPYARNPRKNGDAVAKVAASIKEFGFRQPIVVDAEGVVIVGHTRLEAARQLGITQVPVHVATGLTPGTTGVAEEARFDGLGLSHCAHCDAPLYGGKPVVVAGSDAWALEEAIELAENGAKVTLVANGPLSAPTERIEVYRALGNGITMEGRIVGLVGESGLEAVVVEGPSGKEQIAANGLFLQTGRVPATSLIEGASGISDGLLLAGDVRDGATYTLAGAIADGAQAGHNAVAWVKARQGA